MSEALIEAAAAGDTARVRELLAAGAGVDARDAEGATALMRAARAGRLDAVRALVDAGADVNAFDARGWGALAMACHNADLDRGFADVVAFLIERGANVEAPIGYGVRPLLLAARNDGGLTALMMVKEKFYVDVINRLHEAEREAGVGEGSCETKNAPGSNVITFLKPASRRPS